MLRTFHALPPSCAARWLGEIAARMRRSRKLVLRNAAAERCGAAAGRPLALRRRRPRRRRRRASAPPPAGCWRRTRRSPRRPQPTRRPQRSSCGWLRVSLLVSHAWCCQNEEAGVHEHCMAAIAHRLGAWSRFPYCWACHPVPCQAQGSAAPIRSARRGRTLTLSPAGARGARRGGAGGRARRMGGGGAARARRVGRGREGAPRGLGGRQGARGEGAHHQGARRGARRSCWPAAKGDKSDPYWESARSKPP
jgi:hypothetical protein